MSAEPKSGMPAQGATWTDPETGVTVKWTRLGWMTDEQRAEHKALWEDGSAWYRELVDRLDEVLCEAAYAEGHSCLLCDNRTWQARGLWHGGPCPGYHDDTVAAVRFTYPGREMYRIPAPPPPVPPDAATEEEVTA